MVLLPYISKSFAAKRFRSALLKRKALSGVVKFCRSRFSEDSANVQKVLV
jgi:hypothetical protein